MAYLNANIPVQYAQIKRSIYMTLKNIMEKLKTALSLVLAVLQDGYLMACHYGKRCNLLSSPNYGFYSTWL